MSSMLHEVVLATGELDRDRATLARLLTELDCPVTVSAPAGMAPVRSVTVLLRGDQDDDALLEVAFTQARQHGCGVLAVLPWQPGPDIGIIYAETAEQKAFDGYLAGWQERFPDVGVTAELRIGDLPHVVEKCASNTDLLILPVRRPVAGLLDPALNAVLAKRTSPTVLVPEPQLDRVPTPEPLGGRSG